MREEWLRGELPLSVDLFFCKEFKVCKRLARRFMVRCSVSDTYDYEIVMERVDEMNDNNDISTIV